MDAETPESTVKCWTDVRGRMCTDICAYIIKHLSNLSERRFWYLFYYSENSIFLLVGWGVHR